MGKLGKKGSGEGESKLKKRKRPAGARGSRDAVWGNSLAWKNVTPNDSLSILVGSDEGGFMSLEEIDGDVFAGTTEEGGLLGAIPEANEKPEKEIKKIIKKKSDSKKAVESSELVEGLTSPSERDDATVPSDGSTPGSLSRSSTENEKRNQKKKKKKEKKLKVGKNATVDGSSNVENSETKENNSKVDVTPSKKKSKVDSKSLFVMGPVINTVAGDTDGSAPKDVREDVTDIETKNSKDSTPVTKGTLTNIKEDGSGKKVKLGSKARRLLRLQKQQKQQEQNGVDEKQGHVNEDKISEADMRKREDMEIERLENSPSSEADEIEEIDMSAWAQLRLNPLLMRALMKLKFSKPTHIQEKCIAAAAYQGKDVIGAAETGSGKTLAFGLPILQRLLDDHEKIQRKSGFDKASKKQSGGPLRALIVTPTRELALQVCDHLRAAAQFTNFNVVPIVGGMALQKQQRLLRYQPQIVVGTPGRLWELMSAGESHLLDLAQLSFFVLDEADRMVERGHFKELQSIMDMLPKTGREPAADNEKPLQRRKRRRETPKENEEEQGDVAEEDENVEVYPDSDDDNVEETNSENVDGDEDEGDGDGDGDEEEDVDGEQGDKDQQLSAEDTTMEEDFPETIVVEPVKKRQTLVFSATLSLPPGFKKKLKRGFFNDKSTSKKNEYSVASLIQRAAMRDNAVIIDLTTKDILARKLEESVIECRDEEKDAYLYYILKVHGCGRTLVFCTSIAALRHVTAILRLLQVSVWPLHAQMQQKQRLKAMDRFKAADDCVMVATDVAARGLDVTGIRTVIHYQLPHSAEMYVHRSGRTARADTDGCSIAIISPSDRAKYNTLCRNLDKANGLPSFPIDVTYIPAVLKRVSLAFQVDRVLRKHQQFKAKQSWVKRNAEALELDVENSDDDDEASVKMPVEKRELMKVQALQQELQMLLKQPLEPKAFSRRYVTGSGVTPVLAKQLKEYTASKLATKTTKKGSKTPVSTVNSASFKSRLLVIGQEPVEPLDALRRSALLQTSSKPIPVTTPKLKGFPSDSKAKGSSSGPKSKRRRR